MLPPPRPLGPSAPTETRPQTAETVAGPSVEAVYVKSAAGIDPSTRFRAVSVPEWAKSCFSGGKGTSTAEFSDLMEEATAAARNEFDAESAVGWAAGYQFPSRYLETDAACLEAANMDFVSMVGQRLVTLAADRLSVDRVHSTLHPHNPERERMCDLAGGMHVHRPSGFIPNGQSPRTALRATYLSVSSAVNKMLGDVVEQRLAFLIPLDVARKHVPNLHLCKAHWTRKKGKASGRPLGDLSFVDGTPLNTPETSAAAADYYGAILHPTIEDIAQMVCRFWTELKRQDPTALWSSLRIWKMDLKGAYTLLSFRPEDVGLFGMLLTGDLVYFQIAGIFGWAGTPAAFQVVTRAISWELTHALRSFTLMYVDDVIGVGTESDIPEDLRRTRDICTRLLGPSAVADDKTEVGRRLDVIGYTIDLDIQRVLIARKNFLNALHGFLTVDPAVHISVRTA